MNEMEALALETLGEKSPYEGKKYTPVAQVIEKYPEYVTVVDATTIYSHERPLICLVIAEDADIIFPAESGDLKKFIEAALERYEGSFNNFREALKKNRVRISMWYVPKKKGAGKYLKAQVVLSDSGDS